MGDYALNFIYNNAFYILTIFGIFLISAIYSTKVRSFFIMIGSLVLIIGLCFTINHFSTNNETIRSILIALITLICDVFQLIVHTFLLNVHVVQMIYSAGAYEIFHTLAFDVVVDVVVFIRHICFLIRSFFKRAVVNLCHYVVTPFYYAKKIILDSIFGSFYQVMRN